MINFISGKLIKKNPASVVVENGGIGFNVLISSNTYQYLPELNEKVKLNTYLYVREDQLTLFGFYDEKERGLFLTLISISGIGAKGAIKILSGIAPDKFVEVVAAEDVSYLTKIPGIGKKSAQRIIVELREKLPALSATKEAVAGIEPDKYDQALQALGVLGLSHQESRRALEKLTKTLGADKISSMTVENLIKETLKAGR